MTLKPTSAPSRSKQHNVPTGWGEDLLSSYIETAENNVLATFANNHDSYAKLVEIDTIFRELINGLDNTPQWFESIFVLRSHSAFLSTIRLAMAGSVTECYATIRQSIEFALYGNYLFKHPELQEIWLTRTDSEESKALVKRTFKLFRMLNEIESCNPEFGPKTRILYEQAIDFGAHPNETSVTTTLQIIKDGNARQLRSTYLHGSDLPMRFAFKTIENVGICILGIFKDLYHERYDHLGLSNRLTLLANS